MAIASGTRFGSYEIRALIGVGGMGEVYRAHDASLKRDVALKVLGDHFADANAVARLQREAEILASLNHSSVAHIYGLERSEGRTALVMELVDGPTLADRIGNGPLPTSEALAVAEQIASALEAAHERGIVHRDLKPANVKLKSDGTVKLLDFGIAKALGVGGFQAQASSAPTATEIGTVLGTAPYMSPEQARGSAVDKRADIWAFGCVLYEMLTGRTAFLGDDTASTLARVLEREPDMRLLPAGISAAARRTLELCLQKDVKQRLRDMGDARLSLAGKFAPAAPPTPPTWLRWMPIAAALLIGALGIGAYLRSPGGSTAPRSSPLVTRFVVTPPASAPLANLGGFDLAISPDGRRLAWLGRNADEDSVALYVRELDAVEPTMLRGTEVVSPSPNVNPFFSRDGKSIGFAHPDGSVMRARLDGTLPQEMFDSDLYFGATWITDDAVVVSTGARLELVSAAGAGTPQALTSEEPNVFVAAPSPLPGGKAVLFMSRDGAVPRVALLDLETREQKILIEGGQRPVYASTGHIVFARNATLMAVPFDAVAHAVTGEPVELIRGLRFETNNSPDYVLSSNGTLAYVPGREQRRWRGALVWVDRAGTVVGRAVAQSLDGPDDPRLSPDGARLAVTTGAVGEGRLWIYDLRGRPPIPLTAEAGLGVPIWSPDGRQIAFTSFNTVDWLISAIDANGSGTPRPIASAMGLPQDWSAGGDLLFVSARDIRAVRAVGGDARNLVSTEASEFDAAVSPDGRLLAYVSDRTGRTEVWVQTYDDSAAVPVRISTEGGYEPRWSADGKELFYRQGRSLLSVAVDVATGAQAVFGAPTMLFSGPFYGEPTPSSHSYDVARDGRFLMIQTEEAAAERDESASIVVVQNWFEELKQRVPAQ